MVDQQGNWTRVVNRLRSNNLKFHGGKAPSASSASSCVSELLVSLRLEGANPNFTLPKALGYADAMKELEGAGHVTPIVSTPKPKSDKVASFGKAHKEKVSLSLKN